MSLENGIDGGTLCKLEIVFNLIKKRAILFFLFNFSLKLGSMTKLPTPFVDNLCICFRDACQDQIYTRAFYANLAAFLSVFLSANITK